jgi:hypothetical protein
MPKPRTIEVQEVHKQCSGTEVNGLQAVITEALLARERANCFSRLQVQLVQVALQVAIETLEELRLALPWIGRLDRSKLAATERRLPQRQQLCKAL